MQSTPDFARCRGLGTVVEPRCTPRGGRRRWRAGTDTSRTGRSCRKPLHSKRPGEQKLPWHRSSSGHRAVAGHYPRPGGEPPLCRPLGRNRPGHHQPRSSSKRPYRLAKRRPPGGYAPAAQPATDPSAPVTTHPRPSSTPSSWGPRPIPSGRIDHDQATARRPRSGEVAAGR